MISSSTTDDVIPTTNLGHDLGFLPYIAASADRLAARFTGAPAESNCADLPS